MPGHDEGGRTASDIRPGDLIRITSGEFKHFEALVDAVDHAEGEATVMFNLFGRHTPQVFKLAVLSPIR